MLIAIFNSLAMSVTVPSLLERCCSIFLAVLFEITSAIFLDLSSSREIKMSVSMVRLEKSII